MKTVIGIDYGTASARAILVDAKNGDVLCTHTVAYPHGVMAGSLASIEDYHNALTELLRAVTPPRYRDTVTSIGVDATSLTLVCVDENGCPLAQRPAFAEREQAQVKLWKRHAAQAQADEILTLARRRGEPFLKYTGNSVSAEWTLPKLLEMRDCDREVYNAIDLAMDLCEYLTFCLTGIPARSTSSLGYKGLWSQENGLPPAAFLDELRPGLSAEYARMMRGQVFAPGERVGKLKAEWCRLLGLREDVTVACGLIDGHTASAALGAMRPGDAAIVVGTSNVLAVQFDRFREIDGVCGVVENGMVAGAYGMEGGQNCTGDMLDWYVKTMLTAELSEEAARLHLSPHQLLVQRITNPWENKVVVLDWFSGSRNVPSDLSLRGTMVGLSLDTTPEQIYLALLQSIVCGTREILERCRECGVAIERIVATGGISQKNPLLMQEYAEILNLPIHVGQVAEGPAFGTALFAAVAAGLYPDAAAAYQQIGVHDFTVYTPTPEHRRAYETIYKKHHALRQMMQIDKE